MLPTITLTPKKKQPIGSKILDVVSSTLLEPTTLITKGPGEAGRLVKKRREEISRTKDISKALDVVGETLTSTLVAGGLVLGAANPAAAGGVLRGLIPKTIGGKIGATTLGGVLITSPTARKVVGRFAEDPTKIGREGGILLEKSLSGKEKEIPGVVEALKVGGILGAGVAAAVGAKKVGEKLFGPRPKTVPTTTEDPTTVPTSIALPSATSVPDSLAPIADTPVVASTPKPASEMAQVPDVNVKVVNKPQVNVAIAQSI